VETAVLLIIEIARLTRWKGYKKVLALGVLSLIILAVWVGGVAINRIESQAEKVSE
jgi:hypothetical protein